ncbi:MAG: hypothetical protein AAF602_13745 [Myxococcota bacterium]
MHPSLTWAPGSFPRDTLIFALGELAGTTLREFRADPGGVDQVEQWRQNATDAEDVRAVARTGLGSGRVTLIARVRDGEYGLECEHPEFHTLVVFGATADQDALAGIFVASFEGSLTAAIRFAQNLTKELRRLEVQRDSAWSTARTIDW